MSPKAKDQPADLIARECLAGRIRRLNRQVTAIYDDTLRPLGLRVSQLNVMALIANKSRCTASEVGSLLQLEKSTLSRNLDRLRKQGWVEVEPGEDGRSRVLSISSAGRKLLRRALPLWREAQRRTRKLLGSNAVDAIRG